MTRPTPRRALWTGLLLLVCATRAHAVPCYVDTDADVDRHDVAAIFASRGSPAAGPDDPRDVDGDGAISVADGRLCALRCTLARCAEPPPGRLAGSPSAPALSATTDLAPTAALPGDIADGAILTKLSALLASDATVAQVNAALDVVGGAIGFMQRGSPLVTVVVTRRDDALALAALAETLAAQPGIAAAAPGREPSGRVLPPEPAGAIPDGLFDLEHLLPTRFPAAWNARGLLDGCEQDPVTVIFADHFASAEPAGFDAEIPPSQWSLAGTLASSPADHGFRVATTLAAGFDTANPTGALPFPQCLRLRGVHIGGLVAAEVIVSTVESFPTAGKFVVNFSLGYTDECDPGAAGAGVCTPEALAASLTTPFMRVAEAVSWFRETQSRWNDLLAVAAAGNERSAEHTATYPGLGVADWSSPVGLSKLSGAALLSGLGDAALWGGDSSSPSLTATGFELANVDTWLNDPTQPHQSATNVLVVGSTTRHELFGLLAESSFSDANPDVSAVGEQVMVLGPSLVDGTSFAAPQVSGLAAYLWLISPSLAALPAERTANAIRAATRSNGASGLVIDAYAAVLALDLATPVTPATAPIRRAILDVNGNGAFESTDVIAFADAYGLGDPDAVPPATRDYGRFDLNGDGFTGGPTTAPFDLDPAGSTQFGEAEYTTVTQTIAEQEITLNELALSDLQILCAYAFSPLLEGGDGELVMQLLGEPCLPVPPVQVANRQDPNDVTYALANGGGASATTDGITPGCDESTVPEAGSTAPFLPLPIQLAVSCPNAAIAVEIFEVQPGELQVWTTAVVLASDFTCYGEGGHPITCRDVGSAQFGTSLWVYADGPGEIQLQIATETVSTSGWGGADLRADTARYIEFGGVPDTESLVATIPVAATGWVEIVIHAMTWGGRSTDAATAIGGPWLTISYVPSVPQAGPP